MNRAHPSGCFKNVVVRSENVSQTAKEETNKVCANVYSEMLGFQDTGKKIASILKTSQLNLENLRPCSGTEVTFWCYFSLQENCLGLENRKVDIHHQFKYFSYFDGNSRFNRFVLMKEFFALKGIQLTRELIISCSSFSSICKKNWPSILEQYLENQEFPDPSSNDFFSVSLSNPYIIKVCNAIR